MTLAVRTVGIRKSFGAHEVLKGINPVSYTHLRAHET